MTLYTYWNVLQANPTLVAQRESEFFNVYPNFQEFFHTVAIFYSVRKYYVL